MSTQIPYVLTVSLCSLIGYVVDGMTQNGWLGVAAGFAALGVVMLVILRRVPPQGERAELSA